MKKMLLCVRFFFFQAEDGIRDGRVTGVQTCALPIWRHPQAEQALVERARAGEVRDADGSVIEAAHMDVAHVTSRSSTRKVASGPIRNHDPIQAIQYLRARRSRMRPSSTGSVTTRARPRTRSSPTSSATSGVLRRLRTQSRFAFRVAR